jgi:hypothetical protein
MKHIIDLGRSGNSSIGRTLLLRAADLGSTPNSHWPWYRKHMEKKTVGTIAGELQQKAPESRDPIEIQREMLKDYEKNVVIAIERGLKTINKDFYIEVELKKEKLLENVLRNYFCERTTCPTPGHDQTVFKYNYNSGVVEHLWTVPDRDTCEIFYENALIIVPEERALLKFVLDFYDGTLLRKAKKLNGEDEKNKITGIVLTDK